MLQIYRDVFDKLNTENTRYCIYKGLNHLQEDLNGDRGIDGDIDILVPKYELDTFHNIVTSYNMYRGTRKNQKDSYIGFDADTTKTVFIDLDTKIKLGERPFKPHYLEISVDRLKVINVNHSIKVLDFQDYIPLMFIMRVTSPEPTIQNLYELHELIGKKYIVRGGYICKIVEKILDLEWDMIKNDILNAKDWQELQKKYKSKILKNVQTDFTLFLKQKFKIFEYLIKRVKNKIFKMHPYNIRKKGFLVAFVGVDGAGKSSTVDYLLKLEFFQYTGIKRIYFGNNEYWIPGIVWGLKNPKNRWLSMFFALLAHTDKSLRSLIAYYYIRMGYMVIADRYYYDDFIGREISKSSILPARSLLKKIYRKIFQPRIWIQPDKTFFLDVSPDVAYSRKQDYSYDIMLEVNKAYKEYMSNVKNVVNINADINQQSIYDEVVSHIMRL